MKRKKQENKKNKYHHLVNNFNKTAKKMKLLRLLNIIDEDIIDQIPDNEIIDEPIPFPYGVSSDKIRKWIPYHLDLNQ